ncbi:ABC transporter ATP-binding protein [Candidatus Latescibacterota bacterium]
MKDLVLLWPFIKKRWKSMALGTVFVGITNLLQAFIPSLIGDAVDILQSSFILREIVGICGIILFLAFTKGVFRFLMRYIMIGASWKIENDIRVRLYEHLLKLPISFYTKSRTGDIIARITNDLTAVRMMVGPAVMYSVNAVVLLPAVLLFMFSKDVELTLLAIIPFPFIAVMINRIGKRIHQDFKKVQESYSDISAHVQENLNGIRVTKAYASEEFELNSLKELSLSYVHNNGRVIKLQSLFFPLLDVLASVGIIILLWVGGKKVVAGETTLGTLVSLIMYIGLLVWPAIALGWVVAIFQRGTASMRRILEILEEKPERQDDGTDIRPFGGSISVKNLTFSYDGDTPVLDDISFDVKPGGTIAIVGRTGSGKSTLLELLTGAYDVPRGVIFYDGCDINDLPLSRIRSSVAFVPQETFLFSETVGENIAFGAEDTGISGIEHAASLAAVEGDIASFPRGYETVLGERGITVSAGQRQRLAIARALISRAPILFFDDCLSNVDTLTEMKILRNINSYIKNKTALIVTQRLGAVKSADEILYMKDGLIIEHGRHEDLMKLDGEYAVLYKEQELLDLLEGTM